MAEDFVWRTARQPMRSKDAVVAYQRDFQVYADELITAEVASDGEMGRLFLRGLDQQLRTQLELRLEICYPAHAAGVPYTVKQLVATLLYMADSGVIASIATKPTAPNDKHTQSADDILTTALQSLTAAVEKFNAHHITSVVLAQGRFLPATPTMQDSAAAVAPIMALPHDGGRGTAHIDLADG